MHIEVSTELVSEVCAHYMLTYDASIANLIEAILNDPRLTGAEANANTSVLHTASCILVPAVVCELLDAFDIDASVVHASKHGTEATYGISISKTHHRDVTIDEINAAITTFCGTYIESYARSAAIIVMTDTLRGFGDSVSISTRLFKAAYIGRVADYAKQDLELREAMHQHFVTFLTPLVGAFDPPKSRSIVLDRRPRDLRDALTERRAPACAELQARTLDLRRDIPQYFHTVVMPKLVNKTDEGKTTAFVRVHTHVSIRDLKAYMQDVQKLNVGTNTKHPRTLCVQWEPSE